MLDKHVQWKIIREMSKWDADVDRLATVFHALGSPRRLAIYLRLARTCAPDTVCCEGQEQCPCVGEFSRALHLAPSTVSHHIAVLSAAGLIRTARDGQAVRCWADAALLAELGRFFVEGAAECPGQQAVPFLGTSGAAPGDSVAKGGPMVDHSVDDAAADRVRRNVRRNYAQRIEEQGTSCCGSADSACGCGVHGEDDCSEATATCCGRSTHEASGGPGYAREELASVPEDAAISFGCGNPGALAGLQPGETVLDLGSGGGLDCLLAAQRVGPAGRVIGVDMTPEMIDRARASARAGGYRNVEFRLGEIEHLPVADGSIDVIISNCVINLSPDKPGVFAEAYRVLRPGGRMIVSDVVALAPVPDALRADESLWCDCVSGAEEAGTIEAMLRTAGFADVLVTVSDTARDGLPAGTGGAQVTSAIIEAWKPAG